MAKETAAEKAAREAEEARIKAEIEKQEREAEAARKAKSPQGDIIHPDIADDR